MAKSNLKHFLKTRGGLALTGLVCLAAAWLMFIRASDTGSLQQYGLLLLLLVFAGNRFAMSVHK